MGTPNPDVKLLSETSIQSQNDLRKARIEALANRGKLTRWGLWGVVFNYLEGFASRQVLGYRRVSKNFKNLVDLVLKAQVKKLYPKIDVFWDSLQYPEKMALASPYFRGKLDSSNALSPSSKQDTLVTQLIIDATADKWNSVVAGYTPGKRLAFITIGNLSTIQKYNDIREDQVKLIYLYNEYLQGATLDQIFEMTPGQVDAVIKELPPGETFDLTNEQINLSLKTRNTNRPLRRADVQGLDTFRLAALEWGLTREQVIPAWFSQMHFDAVKEGLKYDDIAGLQDFQIDGIRLKLTREQVLAPWFKAEHVQAIKEGFEYAWINNISVEISMLEQTFRYSEFIASHNLEGRVNCRGCQACEAYAKVSKDGSNKFQIRVSGVFPYEWRIVYMDSYQSSGWIKVPNLRAAREKLQNLRSTPSVQCYYFNPQPSELEQFKALWKNRLHILRLINDTRLASLGTNIDGAPQNSKPHTTQGVPLGADGLELKTRREEASINSAVAARPTAAAPMISSGFMAAWQDNLKKTKGASSPLLQGITHVSPPTTTATTASAVGISASLASAGAPSPNTSIATTIPSPSNPSEGEATSQKPVANGSR